MGETARLTSRKKHVLACALITLAVLAWIYALGVTEPVLRISGLVLQLLGVLTVAWGISETRAFFGRPTIASSIRSGLRALFLPRRVMTASLSISLGPMIMKARGYGIDSPVSSSVEDRLAAIESNIKHVHKRISGLETEYDQELQKLLQALKEEASTRSGELSVVSSHLEAFGTGGIHISAIGAVWLFIGLILSTAAVEIARAFSSV